jgi:hypothetical protein
MERRAYMDGPSGGVAESLDGARASALGEAKAAFLAAEERRPLTDGAPGRGRPASAFHRKAHEICSG